ncbi:MAG: family 20 glycosylhydrolase, partial [Sphingobacteriales bacterium]
PKLTEVGAWNVKKVGRFGTFSKPEPNEPRDHGGFYTQEDIRELVQYAKERKVDILPEIDVPGHSLAAIAAYPELTSTPGKYQVNSGEKFMEWPPSGHFYGLLDNTLNPANEKVFTFLDKIFGEVAQLFPFDYIHMGGDETARNFWEKSPDIKALMAREKLKDLDEVQAYFVSRVNKI